MKYYLPDFDEAPQDAQVVPGCTPRDPRHYAQMAADWMHARRGFWEVAWPITIVVLSENDQEHWFTVAREQVPEFRALETVPCVRKS